MSSTAPENTRADESALSVAVSRQLEPPQLVDSPTRRDSGDGVTRELIAEQDEADGEQRDVGRERVSSEAAGRAPRVEDDQHHAQREQLPDLDADVERDHVRDEPVARDREVLELGREAEAVEEAEEQHRGLGVRLEAERAEAAEVLERLVDHRQADHRVDEVRVHVQAAEHAEQQRHAVADGEQRDVERHVLEAIEEEDHAREEREVVVAGDHVLRAEVDVRPDVRAARAQQERLIVARDPVRRREPGNQQAERGRARARPTACDAAAPHAATRWR